MNYLEELKNRSIFLWHALFGGGIPADEAQPVYINRAPTLPDSAGAQETEHSAAVLDAENGELENAEKTAAEESGTRNIPEDGPAAVSARQPDAMYQTVPEGETQESVLRGITEAELAAQSARQPAPVNEMSGEQEWPEEQENAARGEIDAGGAVLTDLQDRPGGRGAAGAEKLLLRVSTATRSGGAAERRIPFADTASPMQTEGAQPAGPADVSAWFERDARRYDGAYELM